MPPDKAGIIPRLRPRSAFPTQPVSPLNERPMSTALRPSACPGLLRIVQALDGGICRIKLNGGAISAEQADAVADAGAQFAGGVIEATNRANLQIRGIGQQSAALIDTLLAADLGPRTAAGDDVRNLMLSPAAGIDRQMRLDTRALAGQILDTLQSHPRFHALSAKFAVQLDGGEALAMLEHPHDLWLSAFERDGETLLAFGLAGCPTDPAVAAVSLENGHALVVAVLELFLERARPEQTRMRHLLDELPLLAFLEQLRSRLPITAIRHWQRPCQRTICTLAFIRKTPRVWFTSVPFRRWGASIQRCCAVSHTWPASSAMAACASPLGKVCCYRMCRQPTRLPSWRRLSN